MNLKALVIDDSGVMRKMVIKSVTETQLANFDFVEAVDGKDGLDKISADPFDIAFVDWNMPNMTGIDFVRAVRNLEKTQDNEPMPLVMVTSEKTIGKLQEALDEAGADQFISKPFTVDELKVKLKKAVSKAQVVAMQRQRRQRARAAASQPQQEGGFLSSLFG